MVRIIMTTTNAPPAPLGLGRLSELSDDELLASTRKIVGRSNQLLAALLAHLGEVEARGIYRVRSCASVYTYCVYELRMSEDAAFRRARAAKIARQYPVVLDKIAAGEIHLTALLMLGPHLTEENDRTFVDARGERCGETSYLQLHHVEPHGRGGAPSESNLYLRCRAHNALAAEEDFGRDLMTLKKRMTATSPMATRSFVEPKTDP